MSRPRYALEHQVVFHETHIGFPSLLGCHGLVYVTDAGLFGYHNYGGEIKDRYTPRFAKVTEWLRAHPSGRSPGRAVYGACFLTPKADGTCRAYDPPAKQSWIAELTAFAAACNGFAGPIYGYDLGLSGTTGSAIAEFTRVGATCVVQVRPWGNGEKATETKPNDNSVNAELIQTQRGGNISLVDISREM